MVEHNADHGIYFSRNMHDSIVRNNNVYNTTSGITVSESPNNQIYNNTIEGAIYKEYVCLILIYQMMA